MYSDEIATVTKTPIARVGEDSGSLSLMPLIDDGESEIINIVDSIYWIARLIIELEEQKKMTKKSGRYTYGQRHTRRGGRAPLGDHNQQRKPQRRTNSINQAIKDRRSLRTTSQPLRPLALAPRQKVPRMNECKDIETMVNVAFDNFLGDSGQLRDIAAFWSHSTKIIEAEAHEGIVHEQQTLVQLKALRSHTVKHIEQFEVSDFAKSFIALAKIFSLLTKKKKDTKMASRGDFQLFRRILVERGQANDEAPSENPFQFYIYATLPLLPRLSPRDMACVSYALSLLKWEDSSLKGVKILLDGLSAQCVSRVKEFDSRSLSRILFDVAKSGRPQPELFSVVGNHLCGMDAALFAPTELANLSYAFATSTKEVNSTIFQKVVDAINVQYTSTTRLAWFKPTDLATIMWSFARAEELQHKECMRKMQDALYAKLHRLNEDFSVQDWSNIIWALSKSSSDRPSVLSKIAERINLDVQSSLDYDAVNITALLWMCCELNVHIEDLFCQDSNFMMVCLQEKDEYRDVELGKLYRFHLWLLGKSGGLPSELADRCFENHLLPNNLLSD